MHIMLDLETLGVGPDAAIISIGATRFDIDQESTCNGFYEKIDLTSALKHGSFAPSTIQWWMQQSDAARQSAFSGGKPLEQALSAFNHYVTPYGSLLEGVWGNGATFDNVVIRSAFRSCGINPAWSFRLDRCYRTVINLIPKHLQPEFIRSGVSHNALDDAITQALHLQKCWKLLSNTQ